MDGVPDQKFKRKVFIFKIYLYRLLASLWTFDIKETVSKHGSKKDIIIKFLRAIKIHHLYKQDTIYKKLDKLYENNIYGKTKDAGILSGSKIQKEIVPTSWWGKGTNMLFNDLEVKVPYNYDNYLKQLFGNDYMTNIPKPHERTKSHFYEKIEQE